MCISFNNATPYWTQVSRLNDILKMENQWLESEEFSTLQKTQLNNFSFDIRFLGFSDHNPNCTGKKKTHTHTRTQVGLKIAAIWWNPNTENVNTNKTLIRILESLVDIREIDSGGRI